ncbi:MAG: hypothetical protein C4345_00570 [Chloroflexota bacterium]
MHWAISLLVSAVLLVIGHDLSHAQLATAAASRDVVVWAELSSKWPAVGCTVGITVALSSGGASLEGVPVAVALAVDGEVIAIDEAMTDGNGLAVLAVDTTDTYAGADGWIDVNVADRYVSGFSLYPVDAAGCESENDTFMKTVTISVDGASEESAMSRAGAVFINTVPTSYVQQRNLSCEYASLYIATATFGQGISEYAFDDVVGWSENPHWGYRGDINGWWGNTNDYGVYAEALVPALAAFGFYGEAFYGDGDPAALTSRIDRGMPTLVWLALRVTRASPPRTGPGISSPRTSMSLSSLDTMLPVSMSQTQPSGPRTTTRGRNSCRCGTSWTAWPWRLPRPNVATVPWAVLGREPLFGTSLPGRRRLRPQTVSPRHRSGSCPPGPVTAGANAQ